MVAPIRKLIWHPEGIAQLQTGEKIGAGDVVRAKGDASMVLTLADGSRVEMRAGLQCHMLGCPVSHVTWTCQTTY
jgi:hypothetical protein